MIHLLVQDALPELADDRALDARVAVIYSTLRGLGMQQHFVPRRDERRRELWPVYRASISLLLSAEPRLLGMRTRA